MNGDPGGAMRRWLRRIRPGPAGSPWHDGAVSIREKIERALAEGTLRELSFETPEAVSERGFGFVAGAKDAVFGGLGADERDLPVRRLAQAVEAAVRRPSAAALAHLDATAAAQSTIALADDLGPLLQAKKLDAEKLADLGVLLAAEAPGIETAKLGIVLIGIAGRPIARDLLLTLGSSDELTVFAAVALRRTSPTPERDILRSPNAPRAGAASTRSSASRRRRTARSRRGCCARARPTR